MPFQQRSLKKVDQSSLKKSQNYSYQSGTQKTSPKTLKTLPSIRTKVTGTAVITTEVFLFYL